MGGQYDPGLFYEYGLDATRDYSVAMEWYHKAAYRGHAINQCSTRDLYAFGPGVLQVHINAMGWCLRAADQDLPMTQFRLGAINYNGNRVSQDRIVRLDWLYKAFRHKNTDVLAQCAMGYMYDWGVSTPSR